MSSAYVTYRPRRKMGPGIRRFANRAAMLANAVATRTVGTQRSSPGRPRKSLGGKTVVPVASAKATATRMASSTTLTRRKPSRSSKTYRAKARPLTASTPAAVLRGSIKTIPQIWQAMNEVELGYGQQQLVNIHGASGVCPLAVYCLTTLDRPNADRGDTIPAMYLGRDTSFTKGGQPVVFGSSTGIANGNPDPFASASKLFLDSIKIRMLFWGRVHKETTYQIQVFRFKKEGYHINPYTTPDESLSLSLLSTEQLSERKAFWIDYMLRKHSVNPVAISQNIGARFGKYIDVVYSKSVTIAETESTMDEGNKQLVTAMLPIRRFLNFNHDVNSRYDENTDADRTDSVINTLTNDMADTVFYHKARVNQNYWLCVRANNTVTTGTGGENTTVGQDSNSYVPTFDLSFQCNYKVLDAH